MNSIRAMSTTGAIQTATDSIVSFLVCSPVGLASHDLKKTIEYSFSVS